MSFFKRKAKSKEPERPADARVNRASPHSPSLGGARNQHAIQEAAGPSHVAINAISANMDSFARGRTAILKKQPSHMEAAHFGDLGHSSVNYMSQETRSRLSKTLEQIVRDGVAAPYYVRFLESRGAAHLVRFWLEAERFRDSSWSRVRAHSLNSVKHSSLAEPVPAEPEGPGTPTATAAGGLALWDVGGEGPGRPPQPPHHRETLGGDVDVDGRPGTPRTPCRQTPTTAPTSRAGTPIKQPSTSIESDAVSIFTKYISPDAAMPIPITEQIRNDIVAKICGEDGLVDPNCFVIAQSVIFIILEQQHFIEFLRSHHFCKYQIEVLTSGAVFLADILFSESALFYFSEYMEKEEAVNVLQFWLAADNFQDQLAAKKGQYDGQEAQNDAMILYDKYFSLQATNPLGFGDSVFMPGFLSSNLYYKYLSDLINSVRADEFVSTSTPTTGPGGGPADGDRGAPTDGSQAQHGTKKAAVRILKNFDEAITVDASSLDPEAQEEMAWKIAKMIVNDVIHQSNHDSPVNYDPALPGKNPRACRRLPAPRQSSAVPYDPALPGKNPRACRRLPAPRQSSAVPPHPRA
ncbi:hypothetical protein CRUP_012567 [Coryphaenoides rupestris]|nr:hypothetical protein CRUP_012567 [Coryphaenoides rupestris]